MQKKLKIAFFGGEPLGLPALEALVRAGLTPELVVCNPDRPSGRGLELRAPRIKKYAQKQGLEIFQPISYKSDVRENLGRLINTPWDLFVVVAYNFILPEWLLKLPQHGTINVHPSLLPKLRGMSPIRTAILENTPEYLGVSIMLMDEKMDHGPILAQTPLSLNEWPISGPLLDDMLGQIGGEILALTIADHINGTITPTPQQHDLATYTKRFEKSESEISLDVDRLPTGSTAHALLCKIKAFEGIGDTYFVDKEKRIKIKSACVFKDALVITRVVPEGKKEMDFTAYLASRK